MKKLYLTLLAALVALGAGARELTFYYGDTPIADGSTITFNDIKVVDEGSYFEVEMAPDLYISSDIYTQTVEITAECTSGQTIQMCAGGSCSRGTSVTKSKVLLQTKQKLSLQFDYINEFDAGEEIPTVTTVITAFDTKYPATKKSFTIIMGKNASVSDIATGNVVSYTPDGLAYAFAADSDMAIFDITGKQIYSARLSGSGVVDTSNLAKGLYLYRAGAASGKFIVK